MISIRVDNINYINYNYITSIRNIHWKDHNILLKEFSSLYIL